MSQIDWDKFTPLAGYTSNNSARVCFRPFQKKLNAFAESMVDLGENADDVADAKAPTTPASVKKTRTPGSKGKGRPKKRKSTEMEDGTVDGEGGDTSCPTATSVTEELTTSQPGPELKNIKLEDMSSVDALCEDKQQGMDLEQPAVVLDAASTTGMSHILEGAPAAGESQECQGLYNPRAEDLGFDFSEYVHQDAFE